MAQNNIDTEINDAVKEINIRLSNSRNSTSIDQTNNNPKSYLNKTLPFESELIDRKNDSLITGVPNISSNAVNRKHSNSSRKSKRKIGIFKKINSTPLESSHSVYNSLDKNFNSEDGVRTELLAKFENNNTQRQHQQLDVSINNSHHAGSEVSLDSGTRDSISLAPLHRQGFINPASPEPPLNYTRTAAEGAIFKLGTAWFRAEEVVLVTAVLVLWLAAISLFINR